MSPRAAWRLESLGFQEVYDYEGGKQDWAAAGLPMEGTLAALTKAGDVALPDVPTCELQEPLGQVRTRMHTAGWDVCVVLNPERVVMGLLRREQLETPMDDERAERVMRPGPSTFRPNVDIGEMAHYMGEHDLPSAPITTSDGRLVGMLMRADAERAAHGSHGEVAAPDDAG
ncbi:MAG: CBS domain-containing protein [Actinobacteria bacterium]|nr:CBS domain-containing protein [Actinomycetota bacterium]